MSKNTTAYVSIGGLYIAGKEVRFIGSTTSSTVDRHV